MTTKEDMIMRQLQGRDISDPDVIDAMRNIDRENFIPENMQQHAYDDGPLPIGRGQTISQPYIVAYMAQLLDLEKSHIVLEVGTGCGYNAAVLSKIVSHVYASDKNFNRALNLIEMVHEHLGKHHPKDERTGWISGLPEKEGEKHPTIAGLRIGKKLPERDRSEPFNDRLEWERDGQYFHYITRWITALLQAEQETEDKQMYSPNQPPEYRLAFRECVLSLGLRVLTEPKDKSSELNLDVTKRFNPLAEDIEIFWVDPVNQNASTWTNHLDINEVSLASSLIAKVYPHSFY